jgi:hypothetical protein
MVGSGFADIHYSSLKKACQGQNTLTYFVATTVTKKKAFVTLTPGANVKKTFFVRTLRIFVVS